MSASREFNTVLTTEFPPERRNIPDMLRQQADRYGDRTLFACGGERWSYREACGLAARTGTLLMANGIARGDRVAILCGNRAEIMQLILGCGWIGAVSVPINAASRGFQLQHMLSNSGAKILAIEAELIDALDAIDLTALALERVWVIGAAGPVARSAAVPVEALPPVGVVEAPAAVSGPGELFTILYTSGTTGLSKGVCCPHAQYFWWAAYTGWQLGVRDGDVLHTPLPLFHTNALNTFFQALLHGATLVAETKFSVSGFWPALAQSGATVTYLLGAMVPMLLSRPPSPVEQSHKVRVALAPGVPGQYHAEFTERTGVVLLDGYGSTESNLIMASYVDDRKPGTMGRLVPGMQARIVDDNDNEVPDGEAGELILRADQPFAFATGYFAMPEKTVEAWRNLWLHTGDRVIRDPDGYYRFMDRMKDAIRRRGENISSFEVEQVLIRHPAVALAAVFPVSADMAEDEVMAAIVLKDDAQATHEELVRFCEGKMSYFAIPRFVEFVASLPRTENGKVQKFKLRDQGRGEATWDREAAGVVLKR
ncbi:MAG: AMP-binding protein [Rhodopseudomonas sp.]|nr:AMP-binding protein [Rhodopseudomonas sp.]